MSSIFCIENVLHYLHMYLFC